MMRTSLLMLCLFSAMAEQNSDDVEKKVMDLVNAMNTSEKYGMMEGMSSRSSAQNFSNGFYVGTTMAIPRLGIPSLKLQDNGNGFRTTDIRMVGEVTAWSCALGLASTWDSDLVEEFASAAADEFKAKGANVVLGPGLNVHRVALGGRNAEYISGEDPVLGAKLVPAWIKGFQDNGILATAKHFALNNQETNRWTYSAYVTQRAAQEVYFTPFRSAIQAGAAAIMCSYNLVNGTHSCASESLLQDFLKKGMDFSGWVMSDWSATHGTNVSEGLDQDMPGTDGYYDPDELAQLNQSLIDQAVANILRPIVKYGLLLDNQSTNASACIPGPDCSPFLYDVDATTSDHDELAAKIATESVLMLKNHDSILPLKAGQTIGVVGSACNASNDVTEMFNSWNGGNYYVIGGSGRVVPESVVSVYDAILARSDDEFTLKYSLTDDADSALTLADQVDVLIACGGATTTEGADRSTLSLDQEDFLVEVAAMTKVPLAIVALAPGTILTPFADDADALLTIFFGGTHTGTAIANVLFGDHSPASKSPVTFPKKLSDTVLPCYITYCNYTEDMYVAYRALRNTDVAFPFGHGLSYTQFEYTWAVLPAVVDNTTIVANVSISNIGDTYAGAEVPQLYVIYPDAAQEPPMTLRNFAKTPILQPNKDKATVDLHLDLSDLKVFDSVSGTWTFVHGFYQFYVGTSSRDIRLNHTISI